MQSPGLSSKSDTQTPSSSARVVSTLDIQPNPWNPNRQDDFIYQKELASIRQFGFVSPLIVRRLEGFYQIIDGEHRWRAAKELGISEVPIWDLGQVDDAVAKQLTIVLNETRGKTQPDLLRPLLEDLLEHQTADQLLAVLPYTPEQFKGLLSSFDWAGVETLERERPPESPWVLKTFRMPKAAAEVLDDALNKVAEQAEGDLTDWQRLEFLAADYLGGD